MADITFGDKAIGDIASLAVGAGEPILQSDDNALLVVARPPGWAIETMNLEAFLPNPRAKTGAFATNDITSFNLYVKRHRTPATIILANPEQMSLRAYLDHHEGVEEVEDTGDVIEGVAGWMRHTAIFAPRFTPAYTEWMKRNRDEITQEDFAYFLESRMGEIAEPPGADLFEIVKDLRMSVDTQFENRVNLSNGAIQLVYKENIKASVEIPTDFTLVLEPWRGAGKITVKAKLRISKPTNGIVTFRFEIAETLRDVLDDLFAGHVDEVQAATGVSVLAGTFAK